MISTIRAVVDPTSCTAMSSCGPAPLAARPTGGGWGWGCCSSAGSPRGCGCVGRPSRRYRCPRLPERGRASAGVWMLQLVGLLASMALAVASRG